MQYKLFRHLFVLVVLALTLTISSASVSAISLNGKTVLIDGDSLARGSHATVNNGRYSYGDYLGSLGADVTNVAVSGARFYYPGGGELEIANHLSGSVTSTPFDYIVLQGGDNDVDHYGNLDNTYAAIESYFQTVKSVSAWQNSQIFFVITPHMDRSAGVLDKANDLWKKTKRLCTKYHIKCINFFKTSKDDGNTTPVGFKYNLMSNRISYDENDTVEGSVDGSHPSQKAHMSMGQIIAKKFKSSANTSANPSSQNTSNSGTQTYTPSVSTYDGTVETNFFGNMQDDGQGCGVYTVLTLVIDTLSIGVGVLAVIGITLVGIKYLNAKSDVEQAKKARRRLYQILIGLVAYVLLYAGVQWLLPGGHFNSDQSCSSSSTSAQS